MAYDIDLAERVRDRLTGIDNLEEKTRMGGLSFMLKGKLLIRIQDDELLVRCKHEHTDELLQKPGARRYQMKGKKQMKGWLLIDPNSTTTGEGLEFWIGICLAFHDHDKNRS